MNLTITNAESIGLVLSGGGIKGVAHIGVIKALEELNIKIQAISGSSSGALVGALYANGKSIDEMLNFFKETPLFHYSFFGSHKPGLIDTNKYLEILKNYFPQNSFEALKFKLYVTSTNLSKGEVVVFSKGNLIQSLLTSAALPPVFSPLDIEGMLYADGGIMNNFPIEPLEAHCDFILGCNVIPVKEIDKNSLDTSWKILNRTTKLMLYATNKSKLNKCDILLEPTGLEKVGILDKRGIEVAFNCGYEYAMKKLQNIDF